MFVVRNCFVAKPGHGSKLAAQLKEAAVADGAAEEWVEAASVKAKVTI